MTKVLLAEDDPAISEPLARALRREGYEVDVCTDGEAALEQALLAPDLLAYAAAYAAAKTGTVLPSKRPASLARMVLGRVPDLAPTPAPAPARKELAA